jgi:hypothetical protein
MTLNTVEKLDTPEYKRYKIKTFILSFITLSHDMQGFETVDLSQKVCIINQEIDILEESDVCVRACACAWGGGRARAIE